MAKKCIPGVICVENMTLFILAILSISVGYLYYKQYFAVSPASYVFPTTVVDTGAANTQQNLYVPPLNTIDVRGPVQLPPTSASVSTPPPPPLVGLGLGLPVNIKTSTANTPYRQIGILTKNGRGGTDPLILPLFGRNLLNGRDKWQYYTMANSGGVAFNAKLPISVNGRSCTSEYGCDSVSNGDTVYVEGYDDTFRATIYENATLSYIPL
jgi:hypothetical protein